MSTKPALHSSRRTVALLALAGGCLLSACGGSDHPHETRPPPSSTQPPPAAADGFIAFVMARVAALLDNDEPVAIDDVTETRPETTEPAPVSM